MATRVNAVQPGVGPGTSALRHLGAIALIGLAFGAYFVLRYVGLWSEQDTAVFASVIGGMAEAGRLDYPGAYHHGYAFPVWALTLSQITALPVPDLLQLYLPLLGNLLLGVFGFATFRQVLSSDRLGMVAAAILFLVPELVFTVSRGNHEKLTVPLTLLALLALLKGFLSMYAGSHWRVYAGWVAVFYATGFTLITINVFFGSGFIVASTLTLVFVILAMRVRPRARDVLRPVVGRLALVAAATWLLVLLVMWYVYPRAGDNYTLLATTLERLAALFLSTTPGVEGGVSFVASDPYTVGSTDWVSLRAYGVVSSFRWVLFLTSFVVWALLSVRAVLRLEQVPLPRLFLLALFGAFGLQLAASIPVDFLGLSAGSNLQVRMYTYFALFASAVFTVGLAAVAGRITSRIGRVVLVGALAVAIVAFTQVSLVKATLDPSVSNRWIFYHPAEVQAMRFFDLRHRFASLWVDVEGRPGFGYELAYPKNTGNGNVFRSGNVTQVSAHALRSDTVRNAAIAWRRSPPALWLDDRVYDNGAAQIFHRRPRTPFQR